MTGIYMFTDEELKGELKRRESLGVQEPQIKKAFEIPMDDCGLTINVGEDGIWFHFKSNTKLHASFHSTALFAGLRGSTTFKCLIDWTNDRLEQSKSDNTSIG